MSGSTTISIRLVLLFQRSGLKMFKKLAPCVLVRNDYFDKMTLYIESRGEGKAYGLVSRQKSSYKRNKKIYLEL